MSHHELEQYCNDLDPLENQGVGTQQLRVAMSGSWEGRGIPIEFEMISPALLLLKIFRGSLVVKDLLCDSVNSPHAKPPKSVFKNDFPSAQEINIALPAVPLVLP